MTLLKILLANQTPQERKQTEILTNNLINKTKLKIMYNLEQFHFVEVKEQKQDEIICIIEHEDSRRNKKQN